MKVLLTGAAGFIGSHVAERLCARGDIVVGFDNFDAFYPRALKERNLAALRTTPGFSLVEGDLTVVADQERAFAAADRPDIVVHLAALAGVRPSLADPVRYADVNVTGTQRLLELAHRSGCQRVVFASSSSVYGQDSVPPFTEDDPCGRPLSPYAATKRAGELIAFTAHHLHATNITCLRFFTVFGPRQRPDLAIAKFTRLLARREPIELYGDGGTSRDYTWIDDIVDGVVSSVDQQLSDNEPHFRTYNLGGSQTTSLRELVDHISVALMEASVLTRSEPPAIVWKPEQPGDMRRTLADVSRAARDLAYAPTVSIAEGVRRYVAWAKAQAHLHGW